MTDLHVATLDFDCCHCGDPVRVTVRCRGQEAFPAAVRIPCPACGQDNHLEFDPAGQVLAVRRYTCYPIPGPSHN